MEICVFDYYPTFLKKGTHVKRYVMVDKLSMA